MRDCTKRSSPRSTRRTEEFFREKAALKQATGYGLEYSPHYLRQSRSQKP